MDNAGNAVVAYDRTTTGGPGGNVILLRRSMRSG